MELKKKYLIGLDLGTSAVKGILMDESGQITARRNFPTQYFYGPQGKIEFDGDTFYQLTALLTKSLARAVPADGTIAALSVASASGNTMLIDGSGRPMVPVVSWMDERVKDEIDLVFSHIEDMNVYKIVGWPLLKGFPLAHLSWFKQHHPELLDAASRICMSTDYVNFRLTGNWGIDTSTASTFYLQDQTARKWYAPFLKQLNIGEEKLPPIMKSGTVLGRITCKAASETGLLPGTPVVLGSFDHPCAARGTGILKEGEVLISCGTSWVGFYPVAQREKGQRQEMLIDPFLYPEGPWGAMFALSAVSKHIEKYIDEFLDIEADQYKKLDDLAAQSVPGAGGLLLNPMMNKHSMDLNLCKKKDIARALLEGTAYLLRHKMNRLANEGICASKVVMVGGPSETYPWPQITADILGYDITVINGQCAGAAGAAILAGIGIGLYKDEADAVRRIGFPTKVIKADTTANTEYDTYYEKFIAECI